MTLRLGGDGAITGCTSLENPDLTVSGLTISGSFDAEKVLVASGTAAAPSYTFSGDTDNGLYYAGTNSIDLSTAGTNAILIDSSGRVGIGTTPNSDSQLHVKSGANDNNPILRLEAATNNFLNFRQTGSVYDIHVTANDPLSFSIGASERLRIDSSGRVGIGTTSPGQALDVKGIIQTTGTNGWTTNGDTAWVYFGDSNNRVGGVRGGTIAFYSDYAPLELGAGGGVGSSSGSQLITFKTGTTERMQIDNSGNVGIGGTATGNFGAIDKGVLITGSDAQVGLRVHTSNGSSGILEIYAENGGSMLDARGSGHIRVGSAATEFMRIDSSGRLLVGTSSARAIEPYGLGADGQIAHTYESVGDTAPGPGIALGSSSTTARMGPYLYLFRSRGGSVGSNTSGSSAKYNRNVLFSF